MAEGVGMDALSEYSIVYLGGLQMKGQKEVIVWCMNAGLIASKYECPKCGESMRLCERKGKATIDGFEWRCRKQSGTVRHDVRRSLRNGSWFSHSHLSMSSILCLTRYWFGRCMNEFVKNELKVNDHTIVDWYMFCREVCMFDLISKSEKLGGEGVIVEVDEIKLGKMKYVKDKPIKDAWVFGGVQRETNKCFFRMVEHRAKQNLLNVIEEWVLPGSIVMSDCWKSYDCLSEEGFVCLSVNHRLTFKDSKTNSSFDAIWSGVKRFLRNNVHHVEGEFDSYLGEYMWRKMHNHSLSDDVFKSFLQAILSIYKPTGKDDASST